LICDDVYYWAPSGRSEIEVDFLLVRGANLIAVEAKSGNMFRTASSRRKSGPSHTLFTLGLQSCRSGVMMGSQSD